MKIADAYVELRADTRKAEAEIRSSAQSMTKTFAQIFSAAIFVNEVGKAVDAASQLEQAVGGTQAVFKESQGVIDDYAKNSADSLGLSERAFREATSRIGGQLKGLGLSVDEAAQKSIDLAKIGADLAATFGGTTAEAVDALGAAFRGEFDTAERYGLSLTAAKVQAKAMEMGLADAAGQVDAAGKAQATLALITEQTSGYLGTFAREADTAAGAAQRNAAAAENARAKMGEALLPVVQRVTEAVTFLVTAFSSLPGPVQTAVLALVGITVLAGPIRSVVTTVKAMTAAMQAMSAASIAAGSAVGVLAVAMTAYAFWQKRIADQQQRLNDTIAEMSEVADAQILDEFKNAMVQAGLAGKDATEFVDELAEGNRGATLRILEMAKAAQAAGDTTLDWSKVIPALEGALQRTGEAAGRVAADAARGQESLDAFVSTAEDGAPAVDAAAGAVAGLAGGLGRAKVEAQEARDAMRELRDEVVQGLSDTHDVEEATLAFADALDRIVEAGGKAIEVGQDSEATDRDRAAAMRDVRKAQLDAADAALTEAQAVADASGAKQGSAKHTRILRDELIRLRDENPELRAEIQRYIDKLNAIPPKRKPDVKPENADEAKDDADMVAGAVLGIPLSRHTQVSQSGSSEAIGWFDRVRDAIFGIPTSRHVTITTSAQAGVGQAGGASLGGGFASSPTAAVIRGLFDSRDLPRGSRRLFRRSLRAASEAEDLLRAGKRDEAQEAMERSADLATRAVERFSDALRDQAEQAERSAEALEEQSDSMLESIDADYALIDARERAAEAAAKVQRAYETEGVTQAQRADAVRDAARVALELAEAEVRARRERREARGGRLSEVEEAEIRRRALLARAEAAPPALRAELLRLAARLRTQANMERREQAQERRARDLERRAERVERTRVATRRDRDGDRWEVRVFIGDRELTDIVGTEVRRNDRRTAERTRAGRRR